MKNSVKFSFKHANILSYRSGVRFPYPKLKETINILEKETSECTKVMFGMYYV